MDRKRIAELLELGLDTDGGHHKQWCLIKIAEELGFEVDEDFYEDAIAP